MPFQTTQYTLGPRCKLLNTFQAPARAAHAPYAIRPNFGMCAPACPPPPGAIRRSECGGSPGWSQPGSQRMARRRVPTCGRRADTRAVPRAVPPACPCLFTALAPVARPIIDELFESPAGPRAPLRDRVQQPWPSPGLHTRQGAVRLIPGVHRYHKQRFGAAASPHWRSRSATQARASVRRAPGPWQRALGPPGAYESARPGSCAIRSTRRQRVARAQTLPPHAAHRAVACAASAARGPASSHP